MAGRPTRNKRMNAYQLARTRLYNIKRENEEFGAILRREIAVQIQDFAVQSMNSLVKIGPLWSGEFSASWRFVPEGQSPGEPGEPGRAYRYTRNDVNIRTIERYMKSGSTRFQIVNSSLHANLAIDGDIAYFDRSIAQERGWPEPLAEKPKLELGDNRNNPGLRYEIGSPFTGSFDESDASRTAEPDWYITYLMGGGLQADLTRSFGSKRLPLPPEHSVGFLTNF